MTILNFTGNNSTYKLMIAGSIDMRYIRKYSRARIHISWYIPGELNCSQLMQHSVKVRPGVEKNLEFDIQTQLKKITNVNLDNDDVIVSIVYEFMREYNYYSPIAETHAVFSYKDFDMTAEKLEIVNLITFEESLKGIHLI